MNAPEEVPFGDGVEVEICVDFENGYVSYHERDHDCPDHGSSCPGYCAWRRGHDMARDEHVVDPWDASDVRSSETSLDYYDQL